MDKQPDCNNSMENYSNKPEAKRSKETFLMNGALVIICVLIRVPDFFLHINRDSGMFAYGGWRILHGALPYVDFWDNKLPGVFYINALAISIFGARPEGLVIFQMIYSAVTGIVFFSVSRKLSSKRAAFIASLLIVVYQSCYGLKDEGNYTESYIALPALLAVFLLINWSRNWKGYFVPAVAGGLGMAAAIIKQPAVSVIGAMVVFSVLAQRGRKGLATATAIISGAVVVFLYLVLWMYYTGILDEAIQANLVFNRLYFIDSYTYGLEGALWNLVRSLAIVALPLAGAIAGMASLRVRPMPISSAGWLLVSWFVFDIIGLAMGGRFCNHYFLAILPSSLLLTGLFIDAVARYPRTVIAASIAALYLFFGPVWSFKGDNPWGKAYPVKSVVSREWDALLWIYEQRLESHILHPVEEVAEYVKSHTDANDTIYVWGWDTRIGFLSKRAFPSRYLHTHPLGATGFNRDTRIRELARDLEKNMPTLIIDGSAALPTTAPPLALQYDPPSTCPFFRLDGYAPVKEVVSSNYELIDQVAGYGIYKRKS